MGAISEKGLENYQWNWSSEHIKVMVLTQKNCLNKLFIKIKMVKKNLDTKISYLKESLY